MRNRQTDLAARLFTAALAVTVAGAIVGLVLAAVSTPGRRRGASGGNELGHPPGMVDRSHWIETVAAWELGQRERVALIPAGAPGVTLADPRDDAFPRTGVWTSPEAAPLFPFTELIPSWNVAAPKDTGLLLELRVRANRGSRWSPWLHLGSWGRTPGGPRVTSCRQGVVNVDYLALDDPVRAYQVRVRMFSFAVDRTINPSIRRLVVCYSGVVRDGAKRHSLVEPVALPPPSSWARDLRVPFRTQKDAPKPLAGEICSPTSVSMVAAYFGVDRPTVEQALAIYDPENEIFGNWGRAVARASELGLDAWVTRFRNWDQVKAQIAAGQPVVASIRFGTGEFPSAVLPRTNGHLLVVRGFTPAGDVIVNDPASKERGDGVVYRADELSRAWFDRGGVAYVIRRPRASDLSAAAMPRPRMKARALHLPGST